MSEYIPLEIQAEILKRIPLKPLIQFRSVSKAFKCLIDSPDFIASYGVAHPQPHRFILRYTLPSYLYPASENKYLTYVDDDDHSFLQQDSVPTVPDLLKKIGPQSCVVGSSHGLLCFNGYYKYPKGHSSNCHGIEMFLLWNPSLRKSVGIQVPYLYDSVLGNIGVDKVFGFGVCPVTFDPIILKLECIDYNRKMKDMPDISIPWEVQLFSLSTRTWSVLSNNLPRESIRLRGSQVVIDRFIYWVAFDMLDAEDGRSQSRFLIMSFDLTAKEFRQIKLTDNLTDRDCMIKSISNLHESLVLLEYHTEVEENEAICSLWMMKEQESFTKLYNIYLPDATINQILGFRKTGEIILETRQQYERSAEVEIYEQNCEYTDNLGIDGEEYLFFMCSYMETLLLHDQSDGYLYLNSD